MKHKVLLAISLAALTVAAQARPFEDPRSDRIPALDMAAANERRDPGCVADQLASTGGYRDSAGRVTDFEKAAMARAGRVDLGLIAVSAAYLNSATIEQAIEHSRAYKPDVYIPAHHDAPFNNLWRATEPLFQALRDDNPNIVTVSKGYRQPICFNTEVNISKSR